MIFKSASSFHSLRFLTSPLAVDYKHRVWEGKSIYVTGAPKAVNWRAFQTYFGDFGAVEVRLSCLASC